MAPWDMRKRQPRPFRGPRERHRPPRTPVARRLGRETRRGCRVSTSPASFRVSTSTSPRTSDGVPRVTCCRTSSTKTHLGRFLKTGRTVPGAGAVWRGAIVLVCTYAHHTQRDGWRGRRACIAFAFGAELGLLFLDVDKVFLLFFLPDSVLFGAWEAA